MPEPRVLLWLCEWGQGARAATVRGGRPVPAVVRSRGRGPGLSHPGPPAGTPVGTVCWWVGLYSAGRHRRAVCVSRVGFPSVRPPTSPGGAAMGFSTSEGARHAPQKGALLRAPGVVTSNCVHRPPCSASSGPGGGPRALRKLATAEGGTMPSARGAGRGRPSSPSRLLPDRAAPHAKSCGWWSCGPRVIAVQILPLGGASVVPVR